MKTNFLKLGLAIAIAGMAFTSCKKDNGSINNGAGAQMAFGVQADNTISTIGATSNDGSLTTSATGASLTWTSGIANISAFKFEAKKRGLEIEIRSKGMATVDLFAPVPALVSAAVDTGTYREIEIKALLTKTSGTDLPLVLKGTFRTAGGATVPIELDYNDDAIIKAEAENVTVDGTQDLSTIVRIHLSKLLDKVSSADLDAATRSSGTIIISSTVNTSIYNKVKDNIGLSGGSGGFEKHSR